MYAAVSSLLTETAVDIIGHTQKTHPHARKKKEGGVKLRRAGGGWGGGVGEHRGRRQPAAMKT